MDRCPGGRPGLLGNSYDNTGGLGASTWRHVTFIEQPKALGDQQPGMQDTAAGPAAADVLNRTADSALTGDRLSLGTSMEPLELRAPLDPRMPGTALPGAADGAQRRSSVG